MTETTEKLWINGVNPSQRINVNVDEFDTIEEANDFARRLHLALAERHQYAGDIRVASGDECSGFASGDLFAGDVPEEWSHEDMDAVWSTEQRTIFAVVPAHGHYSSSAKILAAYRTNSWSDAYHQSKKLGKCRVIHAELDSDDEIVCLGCDLDRRPDADKPLACPLCGCGNFKSSKLRDCQYCGKRMMRPC